jgi:transposase IS116/IS110/IS902 family protein
LQHIQSQSVGMLKDNRRPPTAAQQQKQIDALTAGPQRVSAQLELNKPAPKWLRTISKRALRCAGLVPWTRASGGKVYQGSLLKSRNKWLQWAFIEAAWVAVGCSSYFGGLYRRHRARGKNANLAITIIARRMCQISWTLLKERRDFSETFPGRSAVRLTAAA